MACVGEIAMATGCGAATTVTEAEADLLVSAALTADTETVPPDGIDAGAVYMPVELMVP